MFTFKKTQGKRIVSVSSGLIVPNTSPSFSAGSLASLTPSHKEEQGTKNCNRATLYLYFSLFSTRAAAQAPYNLDDLIV